MKHLTESSSHADATPPNLLLIMTDQQRGDALGCDGHPVQETPYLDELAGQGTRFRCAYSASPSCLPARATLLTGQDQWHTGILGMGEGQGAIPDTFIHTMPGELARAGYHTQAIGKNHFHPYRALNGYHNCILDESSRLNDSDYRVWFERNKTGPYGYRDHSVGWNSWMARPTHLAEHLHPTYWTAQQAIDWMGRRDPNKPFFLKVSFARPHSPYDPPQVYYDMYKNRRMPEPFVGEWASCHSGAEHDRSERSKTDAWRSTRSDAEIQRARACYYATVTFIDHQIGRLLYEMNKRHGDALRNTMIVFLSDHGDMLGDHHLWRKTYAYEGSARVPMIVKPPDNWTDAPRGQVRDEVVELRDVMPTLLEAAGVNIPETVTGQSMLPMARGAEAPPWRDVLHGEHCWCYSHEEANHYLTDGRIKYIWYPYLGTERLFDLQNDPGETHDLAGSAEHAQQLSAWRQRLLDELGRRGSTELVENGQLRQLPMNEIWQSPHYRRYNCQ